MPANPETVHPAAASFPCTPGGSVARGRKILWRLSIASSVLLLGASVVTFATGPLVPAMVLLLLAFSLQFALRLFLDAEPRQLRIEGGAVRLRLDSEAEEIFPLAGATARRLGEEEIAHVAHLAERARLVLGGGSFDSHRLGEFDLYASDLANAVLLSSEEKTWVVTPDTPGAFLDAIAATIAPS